MRKAGGYAFITSPSPQRVYLDHLRCEQIGEGIFEIDTFSCCHCKRVIHTQAGTQGDEYFCRNCMAPICPPCADHPCIPFMKKVDEMEERGRRDRERMRNGG